MLYILFGPDEFSLQQSLEVIKKGLGDQASLATNTTVLDGQQVTLDQLRTACDTLPFLAEKRLVIIKGLLERFEPKGKSGRRGKVTRAVDHQGECKLLSACISNLPDSTVLVLIEDKIKNDNPLLKELSSKAEVRSFPLLKEAKLRQWIQRRVTEEGGSATPQAVDLLAKVVGSDLWIMSHEINKLVLYAQGRRIEEKDVKLMVSYAQQASVFTMIDAILEFKAGVAEQLLQQLLQKGGHPAYLLVMLSRQIQRVVRVKELRKQGKPKMEIQNKLGLTSEYALRKTLEQADRHPLEQLKKVYGKLLQTDISIKTGKYDGELALDILVAELCQRHS